MEGGTGVSNIEDTTMMVICGESKHCADCINYFLGDYEFCYLHDKKVTDSDTCKDYKYYLGGE